MDGALCRKSLRYGYVCGLEVEEKTGGLLVDYLRNAPIDRIFYAPRPRGAGIAIERQNALYALHPILHLNGAGSKRAFRPGRTG